MEEWVLTVRRELKETSALGEYGALAIAKNCSTVVLSASLPATIAAS